jgi:membrane-associated phospholipid phosphatase
MSGLNASNMNMNMNMNMGAALAVTSVAPSKVRYNTADYRKLIPNPPTFPIVPTPRPRFPRNWDPDLRSYIFLQEFVVGHPNWFNTLSNPAVIGALPTATTAGLQAQLLAMLDASPDREDRFAEIIDQHDAEGSIAYFLGMMMIDPARHPATYLLIRTARRVGEHVTMVLKDAFMVPRPSQLCPAIVPMIDPPVTPAFPAGHALQAQLIYRCVARAWPGLARQRLLRYLAHRIGENRVIAGLHYPRDVEAGKAVADKCYDLLKTGTKFRRLRRAAHRESYQ